MGTQQQVAVGERESAARDSWPEIAVGGSCLTSQHCSFHRQRHREMHKNEHRDSIPPQTLTARRDKSPPHRRMSPPHKRKQKDRHTKQKVKVARVEGVQHEEGAMGEGPRGKKDQWQAGVGKQCPHRLADKRTQQEAMTKPLQV